jgi:hypothetical protein
MILKFTSRLTFAGFLFAFLSGPLLLNQVYGSVESEDLYPLAFDENGDKKDYADCPHYDGVDPSEYDSMSIQELEAMTNDVDMRIIELNNEKNYNPIGFTEAEADELACLESIRAVENRAAERMGEIANDISELTDLYSQQMDLNERWDSLSSKYN